MTSFYYHIIAFRTISRSSLIANVRSQGGKLSWHSVPERRRTTKRNFWAPPAQKQANCPSSCGRTGKRRTPAAVRQRLLPRRHNRTKHASGCHALAWHDLRSDDKNPPPTRDTEGHARATSGSGTEEDSKSYTGCVNRRFSSPTSAFGTTGGNP